jgi:hypothetical protein
MSSGDLASRITDLHAAATALVEVDLTALADAALLEALAALRPVVCQVQAAETRLVGAVTAVAPPASTARSPPVPGSATGCASVTPP